jgi:hypothetical protein
MLTWPMLQLLQQELLPSLQVPAWVQRPALAGRQAWAQQMLVLWALLVLLWPVAYSHWCLQRKHTR